MSTLERAIAIAAEGHAGQRDKSGAPYVLHPLRMMLAMDSPEAQIAAVLHDVVEDAPGWSLERLRAEGFSDAILDAVEAVTKRPEEAGEDGYFAFVRRAAAHPIARRVKLADLGDNMDLSRIAAPTESDYARLERYRRAVALIQSLPPA